MVHLLVESKQKKSKTHKFPIRRHDAIGTLSSYDQTRLQDAYVFELNLPRHDLYDLYFAQIYHAQSVGVQDNKYIPEITISLENDIFRVISRWKGTRELDPITGEDVIKSGRKEIFKFRERYFRKKRDEFIYNASHEISLAVIPAIAVAMATGGNVASAALAAGAVSLITLTGGTITRKFVDDKKKHPYERVFLVVISFLGTIVFVLLCTAITDILPPWQPSRPTSTSTHLPTPLHTPTLTIVPSPTFSVTPINTPFPTLAPSTPIPTTYMPNYCLYVTQPDDIAASISSWFGISEGVFRRDNNLVNGTEFTEHIVVTINAPCCNSRYPNGSTYSVQKGDTVANLSQNLNISPEALADANNLREPWYIQEGQMLCLP